MKRPNFLWISFEDTSPRYGCYGDPVARTPAVDQLAAEGCRWDRCFSTAPVCAPARSAVITGMYPISIGTHHMRTIHTHPQAPELPTPYSAVPPHYVKCFTEYLRAAGYYCTNNNKTDYQFEAPFTAWDEVSETCHWRDRTDPDQPFFSVFNWIQTHESGMWEDASRDGSTIDHDAIEVPPYFPDTPVVRASMARMYANIEYNDGLLNKLLNQLEEDGLAENTYVFHWSDHGPMPRGKRWPYDSGLRVPLIVRGPGIGAGTVSENLVSTIDLAPTVLSMAGLQVPSHLQGQAFLGNAAQPERAYVYASRDRYDESYDMVRAVRDRRYKLIRNCQPELPYNIWIPFLNRHPIMREMWRLHIAGELDAAQSLMFQYPRPVEELYDTANDPHEVHNLAADPAYRTDLERLRGALDNWIDRVGDWGKVPESEMVRMWYPNGIQPTTAAPLFIPVTAESPGIDSAAEGGCELTGPALLQLYCATQGASITYTLENEKPLHWKLYTQPIRMETGKTVIRAKAIRIGYHESPEVQSVFNIFTTAAWR